MEIQKINQKDFPFMYLGVIDDEKRQNLVYAQSIHDETNLVNIVRLTPVSHITKYRSLTYLD